MYKIDLPYPPINVKCKNKNYSDLILLNYASSVSEFSAVTQYTYHEIAFYDKYKEISQVLSGISEVEMHHLQMLGELIVKLGENPGYWIFKHKKLNYWNPQFLSYDTSLKKALLVDIDAEKAAIYQYANTAKAISDGYIVDILNRIVLDEEYHIKLLTGLYDKYIE